MSALVIGTDSTAFVADIRYGFGSDLLAFGPVLGVEHASTTLDDYAETGAGALALSGPGATDKWTRYGAGAFASYTGGGITALVDARYLTGDSDDSSVQHTLAGSPRSFTVLPGRGSTEAFRLSGSIEANLGENIAFNLGASAYLAGDETTLAGNASLRIAF